MCSKPKIQTVEQVKKDNDDTEVIKDAVQANASTQKASPENRLSKKNFISQDIRTSNTGLEDEIISSKKKLLGE